VTHLPFNQQDMERVIERLTGVLEDEFGEDIAGWGAASLILLLSIVDLTGVDRQEIADHILQPNKYREFLQ